MKDIVEMGEDDVADAVAYYLKHKKGYSVRKVSVEVETEKYSNRIRNLKFQVEVDR